MNLFLDPFLNNEDGTRATIETKFHRGEKKIYCARTKSETWSVDGFAITKRGDVKIYEFNGERWHKGCPHCSHGILDFLEIEKRHDIGQLGYKLEVMWECQFDKMLAEIQHLKTPLIPFILQRSQTEKDLLAAVREGSIFGFLVCNVESPPEVIESMKNFPPIFRREKITDAHLTEYMQSRIKHEKPNLKKFERETLIQCFTATDHLLMTPLAQFYMSKGLILSKVTKFVQYIPCKALLPFAKHVTTMRIDAEKNKMKTKGATAKVFGNSGYGVVSNF